MSNPTNPGTRHDELDMVPFEAQMHSPRLPRWASLGLGLASAVVGVILLVVVGEGVALSMARARARTDSRRRW
jgi:hypothetical protein